MSWLTVALGIALILGVLFEALVTMLLPRRISRAFRATRLFVHALSLRFLRPLPSVVFEGEPVDNWQTSAWMRRPRGFGQLRAVEPGDDHAD